MDEYTVYNLKLIGKLLGIGIIIDAVLLAITAAVLGFKGMFLVVALIVAVHLLLALGLIIYRRFELEESDYDYIRFGPMIVLWYFVTW